MKNFLLRVACFGFAAILLPLPAVAITNTVNIGPGLTFNPSKLTNHVGDTVVWAILPLTTHTVTGDTVPDHFCGSVAGHTCMVTFAVSGTFPYHCIPHQAFGMVGSVTVKDVSGVPP